MGTVRLQATVQEFDIPYLERFLKGISATEINFEKEEDAFDILTPEDLKAIALSKEQGTWYVQAMMMFLKRFES